MLRDFSQSVKCFQVNPILIVLPSSKYRYCLVRERRYRREVGWLEARIKQTLESQGLVTPIELPNSKLVKVAVSTRVQFIKTKATVCNLSVKVFTRKLEAHKMIGRARELRSKNCYPQYNLKHGSGWVSKTLQEGDAILRNLWNTSTHFSCYWLTCASPRPAQILMLNF